MSQLESLDSKRVNIKGSRPSPLSINKSSHVIKKPSSCSTISCRRAAGVVKQETPRRPPVIIYTHSPKIIHTRPCDFMTLVQKLTGLQRPPRPDDQISPTESLEKTRELVSRDHSDQNMKKLSPEENEASSVITYEKSSPESICTDSPIMQKVENLTNFGDIPLFTPNSNDFLYSNSPSLGFFDGLLTSPNMSNSFLEFMEILPEF